MLDGFRTEGARWNIGLNLLHCWLEIFLSSFYYFFFFKFFSKEFWVYVRIKFTSGNCIDKDTANLELNFKARTMDLSVEINFQFNLLAETFRELLWTQRKFMLKLKSFDEAGDHTRCKENRLEYPKIDHPSKDAKTQKYPSTRHCDTIHISSGSFLSLDANEFEQLKCIFIPPCPSFYCVAVAVAFKPTQTTMKNVYSQVQSHVRILSWKTFSSGNINKPELGHAFVSLVSSVSLARESKNT